ncbi:AI-2E family transporter [Sphingomonas sp. MMS24-JH45]
MKRLAPDETDARFVRRVLWGLVIAVLVVVLYLALDLLILAFGSMLVAIAIQAIARALRHPAARATQGRARARHRQPVLGVIVFLGWLIGVEFRQQVNVLVQQLSRPAGSARRLYVAQPGGREGRRRGAGRLRRQPRRAGHRRAGARRGRDAAQRHPRPVRRDLLRGRSQGVRARLPPPRPPVEARGGGGCARRRRVHAAPVAARAADPDGGDGDDGRRRAVDRGRALPGALGLLTGISEFIPYVGPIAAMLPALGLAATQGTEPLIGALIVFAVVRVIQTNFVTPFVTGRVVAIPPAISLFAIIGTGAVFGLFGLFFSGG